jgi:hypothetical protein
MRKLIPGLVLVCLISSLSFAQTVVPDGVYQKVESAIASRSLEDLRATLAESSSSAWYPRLEDYVLKRARQLVVNDDLELAKGSALALVDNNLDNEDAVDLYQSVSDAIELRARNAERRADEARLAEYRQKAQAEKIIQEAERTYTTVTNPETGKKVYLDQDFNTHYRDYTWDFVLGLGNFGFLSDPAGSRSRYGLSGSGSVYYHGNRFSLGLDAFGDLMAINLAGDSGIDWSGTAILSGSANAISRYLELRAGYATFAFMRGNDEVEPFDFSSPVVGLGVRDAFFGKSARLKMAVDYYPGHLSTDDISLALGGNLLVSFILARMQDFSVNFQTGVRDTALLRDDGFMNDAKFILAIGVGDYD